MTLKWKETLLRPKAISGIFSFFLGIVVLIGWYLKEPLLIQLNKSFVPMQYNTALGFILGGLAFFLSERKYSNVSKLISSIVFTLGALTLLQYIFAIDLKIDQLFMDHYITVKTSHPGRMAPNTALCFVLTGLLGFIFNLKNINLKKYKIVGIFSVILFSLSLVAFLGYLFKIEAAFGWQTLTRMAIHTSFGFLTLSISSILSTLTYDKIENKQQWHFVPVSIGSLIFFTLLAQAIRQHSNENTRQATASEAQIFRSKVVSILDNDILAFIRLSMRMTTQDEVIKNVWEKDSKAYYEDFKFYKSLGYSNEDHVVKWVTPVESNEIISGLDLKLNKDVLKILSLSKATKHFKITNSGQTADGRWEALFVYPLYKKNKYLGSSIGRVDLKKLFDSLIDDITNRSFHLIVKENGQTIYTSANGISGHTTSTNSLDELSLNWAIDVIPSEAYISSLKPPLYDFLMAFGFIISIFAGLFTHFYQSSVSFSKILIRNEVQILDNLKEQKVVNTLLNILPSTETSLKNKLKLALETIIEVPWLKLFSKGGVFLTNESDELELFVSKDLGTKIEAMCSSVGISPHGHYNIPIKSEEEVIGVIVLYLEHGHMRNEKEVDFLTACAEIVSSIITSHRREEQLIVAKDRALNAEKSKALFLANMSHEIRTPLNGILGMTELLESQIREDENREKLKIIKSCGNSLLSIISDILDFSKIEAGMLEIEQINFNLKDFLKEQISLFFESASKKGIVISYLMENSVPEWIATDQARLRQILSNLLSNALKFTDKGSITLSVSKEPSDGGQLVLLFRVKDSGIGIDEHGQNKLFKDFSQVDSSTTRRFGGTGLGLSICKQLVEKLGGNITVTSSSGMGTEFTFTIVCSIGHSEINQPKKPQDIYNQEALRKNLRILTVDDNLINQVVLKGHLQKLGLHTELADNGLECIQKLLKEKFDLVFMDCHMPLMDGFETTAKIIADFGEGRPRIVALTASAMKEDIDRCFNAGMDDFLAKPLSFDALKAVLMKTADCEKEGKAILNINPQGEIGYSEHFLLERFGGDESLMFSAINMLNSQIEVMLQRIQKAIMSKDIKLIEHSAHDYKGAISNFYFSDAINLAQKIETAAKENNFQEINNAFDSLKVENVEVKQFLSRQLVKRHVA